jgi:hypothetical protein
LEHNDLLAKLQSKLNKCYLSNKHNWIIEKYFIKKNKEKINL